MKEPLKKIYSKLSKIDPVVPVELLNKFSSVSEADGIQLQQLLREKYFDKLPGNYLQTEDGPKDLYEHVEGRLNRFRKNYIPFINHYHKINKAKILEIGGGTGCSTQALAEQGAEVHYLDIDSDSMEIARHRIQASGQKAAFHLLNALEIKNNFKSDEFDIIIFFASLEHMTHQERLTSLRNAWSVLKPGGILFVLEAPNRLWFFDMHTSFLPFYFWLQDDLAMEYGKKSERKLFTDSLNDKMNAVEFSRWGRGVSYHEFELAFKNNTLLSTDISLFNYQMRGRWMKRALYKMNLNYKYKKIIRKLAPVYVGQPFLEPFLDLGIKKQ